MANAPLAFLRQSGVLSREKDGKRDRFLERERERARDAACTAASTSLYICIRSSDIEKCYQRPISDFTRSGVQETTVAQSVAMVTRGRLHNNRPRKHIRKAPPSFLSHEPRHFSVFVSLSRRLVQCNGVRSHSAASAQQPLLTRRESAAAFHLGARSHSFPAAARTLGFSTICQHSRLENQCRWRTEADDF
jgi:hypothetical protein